MNLQTTKLEVQLRRINFRSKEFFFNFALDRYFKRMFSFGLLMPVLRLLEIATESLLSAKMKSDTLS